MNERSNTSPLCIDVNVNAVPGTPLSRVCQISMPCHAMLCYGHSQTSLVFAPLQTAIKDITISVIASECTVLLLQCVTDLWIVPTVHGKQKKLH